MSEKKEEKLTPQELAVKKYLDEQLEKDECLRGLYVPGRIKDCFKYITSQAKKQAVNSCAMVEDSVVYKWARDYYIEELPKEKNKKPAELPPKVEKVKEEPVTEKKEVTVVKDGQKYDKDGCALLFDFGE